MKKTVAIYSSECEIQAQKAYQLAFALCEARIKANNGTVTLELKALAAAALSLEKAVAVFLAADRLCE